MQFRMPKAQSVAHTLEQLRLPHSRLTLGVAAAAAAAVATVGGTSASAATTSGATHSVHTVSDVTRLPAHTAPVQGPAATVRIGAGMQLLDVPTPSHTTAAAQQPTPPAPVPVQPAAVPAQPAAAPAAAAAVPSVPAPAPPAPPAPPAAPAPPPQPYQLYDSVTPSALPSSSQAVAVYANGHYAAAPGQVGKRGLTLWIDTNGSDPHADVLDVEPGDATPSQAAAWVQQKLNASPNSTAIIYTMRSQWGAVQAAVNQLAWWMPSHTKYWIADPTGVPHIVPGSQATQWYWGQNFDISTAMPDFN
ncbi:MAG TPA: hypothetical protein VEV45_15055 [Streptosporangiaceae bacterium]|nr:hypothetical protein [Streptosporangiaceae bacterium]